MAARKKVKKEPLFSGMDPEKKSNILKVTGATMFVVTFFTLVSIVSYLIYWDVDQSLMTDAQMMSRSVDVNNWGGKLGYRWGHFLVSDCLGLGSFALVFLLGAVAYRLFYWQRSIGLLKTFFVTVIGAMLASFICSYFSGLFTEDTFFGGGLGGDAGYAVVSWAKNLMGDMVTGLILSLLIILWMLFASGSFAHWFASTGERKSKPVVEEQQDDEPFISEEPVSEPVEEQPAENFVEDEFPFDGSDFMDEAVDEAVEMETEQVDEEEPVDVARMTEEVAPVVEAAPVVAETQEEATPQIEIIKADNLEAEVKEELPPYDNRSELERFDFPPPLDLLKDYSEGKHEVSKEELECNNNKIRTTLLNYGIKIDRVSAVVGPTVTLYKLYPAPGVRISSIEKLNKEIGLALGARGVRVVTLSDSVGVEVANNVPSIVALKSLLNDDSFRNSKAELPIAIGYTITQKVKTFDLADAPHLLVAGATKQGKSVGLNVIISSLLYSKHPSELKFVFVDPKMVEFTAYNHLLKHYLAVLPMAASEEEERQNAIIKNAKQAELVLNSLCIEMDKRYELLSAAGVNDFKLYNAKYKSRHLLPTAGHKFLPYLVVVIDEYADLTMSVGVSGDARKSAKSISDSIVRLAQKGRAAGIHVIIATQRPSVNVITGTIKANFPTRIAFRVLSRVDSSTILDSIGAENLIGRGDMLYYAGVEMERVQCALVSMDEINKITKFIGSQTGFQQAYSTPYYLPVPETQSQDGESSGGMIDMQNIDPLFADAARMVVQTQKGSTSDLQRKLGMGYSRAGRVMDQLEAAGIVGPQEGSKPRQVLVGDFAELDEVLASFIQ